MAAKNRSVETMKKTFDEISSSAGKLDKSTSMAVDAISACRGTVIVIGSGKLNRIAEKISADFRSTGRVSYSLDPSALLHGEAATISKNDVVMLISTGNEREDATALIPTLKKIKPFTIVLTSSSRSTLARIADIVIAIPAAVDNADSLLVFTASVSALAVSGMICLSLLYRNEADRKTETPVYDGSGDAIYSVNDLISSDSKTPSVPCDTPFRDALIELTSKGLGAISVTDENGQLAGIITDGDVRRLLQKSQGSLARIFLTNVESVMIKNPKRITTGTTLADALQIMENSAITVLPVVNSKNAPVGMIHLHDLVQLGLNVSAKGKSAPSKKSAKKVSLTGGKKSKK